MDTAVVLAGGKGTRLRPLTLETPKPMLPVAGRPTIEWTLDFLVDNGFKRAILAINYMPEKITDHFGDSYRGMEIIYSVEKEKMETGGAIKLCEEHIDGDFLVVMADNLIELDLGRMMEVYTRNHSLATIALTEIEDPSQYGVVVMDGDMVKLFVEKPKKEESPSNMINAGVYILNKEILDMIPPNVECKLEREIFEMIAKEGKLSGYKMDGRWLPTDNIEKYEKANSEWGQPGA